MSEDAADRLVARAIDRVLDQVPGIMDTSVPEMAAKLQPWAETAPPPSAKTKRPLEELLAELEASVAADPGAVASLPSRRHPARAFFDRLTRPARGEPAGEGRSTGRRRRRGGGGGGSREATPAAAPVTDPRPGNRRRRRRGRGAGTGGGDGGPRDNVPRAAAPSQPRQQQPPATPRAPGSGRRRRGRRGRGGGPGGGSGGQRPAES